MQIKKEETYKTKYMSLDLMTTLENLQLLAQLQDYNSKNKITNTLIRFCLKQNQVTIKA